MRPRSLSARATLGWALMPVLACGALIGMAALVAQGAYTAAAALGVTPFVLLAGERFLSYSAAWLLASIIAIILLGLPYTTTPILSSPVHVYLSDVALGAAVVHLVVGRTERRAPSRSILLACMTVLLAVAMLPGILRGHQQYGASYASQPARIILYSGFAAAALRVEAMSLLTWLRLTLYVGTVIAAMTGAVLLATGGHQTTQAALSTGGVRTLAASVGMYAAGAMLFALCEILFAEDRRRHLIPWLVLVLGAVVEGLSLGRSTLAGLAIVMPAAVLLSRGSGRRRVVIVTSAVVFGLVVAVTVAHPHVPSQLSTAFQRIANTTSSDRDVLWRQDAAQVTLSGFSGHQLFGLGFGHEPFFVFNFTVVTVHGGDPHDGFVYLLAGGGIVTVVAFALLIIVVVREYALALLRGTASTRSLAAWGLAFLAIYLANVAAGPIISQPQFVGTFWLLCAIPFAGRLGDRTIGPS